MKSSLRKIPKNLCLPNSRDYLQTTTPGSNAATNDARCIAATNIFSPVIVSHIHNKQKWEEVFFNSLLTALKIST